MLQRETAVFALYESPTCKFCGAKRKPRKYGFDICSCKGAQTELQETIAVRNERRDLEIQLEIVEQNIEQLQLQAAKLTEQSNLGKRFTTRTFENFERENFVKEYDEAYNFAVNFENNQGQGLLFIGSVGTGKTHLAAAIANHVIAEYGLPVHFTTSIELFGKLRNFDDAQGWLEKIKEIPLLVIDDLGKEKVTDWNREKLFEIINSRYENYLPTIVTSNCEPNKFKDNIGEASFSRLCEMCKGIRMQGTDYRIKNF